MELRRCKKCLLPETHESIMFDEEGVCNICRQNEFKKDKINWADRKQELTELIESHRGKNDYDCIIPFSGGKDSTWTLYYLMKEYKVKPLVVRFDHGFLRPNLNDNTTKVLRHMGADFHTFTPNWKVVQKLMLQSFLEKGDFCWHCHTGIFSYPMHVAIKEKVPLIIWGEPSAEYTSYYSYDQPEEVDEKRFNRYVNLGITALDMAVRLGGTIDKRDFKPFTYPPLKELRKLNYRSVCLGSYIPWDVKTQSEIINKELGWQGDLVENVPQEYNYEKIECYMQGVRDYIKYLKRGYTRPTHLASIDIRNGRLSRPDGVDMIEKFEGKEPPSLDIFLDFVGLTKDEFYEITKSHTVSPWKMDLFHKEIGDKLPDYDKWSVDGKMDRNVALEQLDRWKKSSEI
jgi:N-acetyl sugar amidotransferase